MNINKGLDFGRNSREVETSGGTFVTFIPQLFKGERGKIIMAEKAVAEMIHSGEPMVVKEKKNKKEEIYFVVRKPFAVETENYSLFTISSGGSQDRREDYGWFKVVKIENGIIIHDISSSWGDNHEVVVALKNNGYVEIEGNHGAGFKSRDSQPDFLIRLKSDGSQDSLTDLDVE